MICYCWLFGHFVLHAADECLVLWLTHLFYIKYYNLFLFRFPFNFVETLVWIQLIKLSKRSNKAVCFIACVTSVCRYTSVCASVTHALRSTHAWQLCDMCDQCLYLNACVTSVCTIVFLNKWSMIKYSFNMRIIMYLPMWCEAKHICITSIIIIHVLYMYLLIKQWQNVITYSSLLWNYLIIQTSNRLHSSAMKHYSHNSQKWSHMISAWRDQLPIYKDHIPIGDHYDCIWRLPLWIVLGSPSKACSADRGSLIGLITVGTMHMDTIWTNWVMRFPQYTAVNFLYFVTSLIIIEVSLFESD